MVGLVPGFLETLVNLLDIPPRLAHNQALDIFQDHAPRAELFRRLNEYKREIVEGLFLLPFPEFFRFSPRFRPFPGDGERGTRRGAVQNVQLEKLPGNLLDRELIKLPYVHKVVVFWGVVPHIDLIHTGINFHAPENVAPGELVAHSRPAAASETRKHF
nr:hypothetical protein [uncultured Oscillibacter sp.]